MADPPGFQYKRPVTAKKATTLSSVITEAEAQELWLQQLRATLIIAFHSSFSLDSCGISCVWMVSD
jgi:hypothetical protein